jgi:acyl-CoA hydrolase
MLLWEKLYNQKKVSADEAAHMIHDGDRIMTGNRECRAVLRKIIERSDLKDVHYYVPICNYMIDHPNVGKTFFPTTSFLNENSTDLHREGRFDFVPGEYWQWDKIATSALRSNVALIELSRPDAHGYMSLGTCADYIRKACSKADLVIAEINDEYPFVCGSNLIHVSEVDYLVDEDADNYALIGPGIDHTEEFLPTYHKIGGFLSELISDGATLEIGLGRLNASSLAFLENKKDLGIHTEVCGEIVMYLTEKGLVTNQKKDYRRGKSVFTQVVGDRNLFQWLDHNEGVSLDNCQEVLNPGLIASQPRMTAINNAVEVDLLGQANAEYLKGHQYSGMGGICDFASGAAANPEGKSIVVLESTTRSGKISKITPCFQPGTPVSLPRTAVEYVVTEQGIATLVGKSPKERVLELINVAHPKFREELTYKAKEMGLL